jgi:hypothetical protein
MTLISIIPSALFVVAILVAGEAAMSARATEPDVESLLSYCTAPDASTEASLCLGYISGLADQLFNDGILCATPVPPYGAMQQAFVDWATRNPDIWTLPRYVGVKNALVATWACPVK